MRQIKRESKVNHALLAVLIVLVIFAVFMPNSENTKESLAISHCMDSKINTVTTTDKSTYAVIYCNDGSIEWSKK